MNIQKFNISFTLILKSLSTAMFVILFLLIVNKPFVYAAGFSDNIKINYTNDRFTITAIDAQLSDVLQKIEDKADILIHFPDSLDKQITIHKKKATLKNALKCLLRGFDHLFVYSGLNKKMAAISEVFVLKEHKPSNHRVANNKRLSNTINAYKKKIESLRKNLSRVGYNSSQGKRYLRRIKNYENKIQRIEKGLH